MSSYLCGVDVYMLKEVARSDQRGGRIRGSKLKGGADSLEGFAQSGRPVYEAPRIKAEPAAIANFDALPRPKLPPGRA